MSMIYDSDMVIPKTPWKQLEGAKVSKKIETIKKCLGMSLLGIEPGSIAWEEEG